MMTRGRIRNDRIVKGRERRDPQSHRSSNPLLRVHFNPSQKKIRKKTKTKNPKVYFFVLDSPFPLVMLQYQTTE